MFANKIQVLYVNSLWYIPRDRMLCSHFVKKVVFIARQFKVFRLSKLQCNKILDIFDKMLQEETKFRYAF
jgi:hypothetical protein